MDRFPWMRPEEKGERETEKQTDRDGEIEQCILGDGRASVGL